MSKLAIFAVVLVIATACGSDTSEPPVTTDGPTVSMPGFSFVPFSITINVGGSVIFDFPAEPHNVIFARITGAPTDIQETSNRKVARTFNVAGNFAYDCTIHPGMSGVVVVK
jgi:plastocyanin